MKQQYYKSIIELISNLFDDKKIFDWNTCDWLCVRLLTPIIDNKDEESIEIIKSWMYSKYLWKARASAVSFAQVKNKNDHMDTIDDINKTLIKRDERFIKTSVGWLLREISKENKEYVLRFVKLNLGYFTKETINNALKYFDKEQKKCYLSKLK